MKTTKYFLNDYLVAVKGEWRSWKWFRKTQSIVSCGVLEL